MSSKPPPKDKRHRAPRKEAYVAAQITVEDRTRIAVLQDASSTGVRVLTHTRVEVGDEVRLAIQVAGEEAIELEGRVVRRDELADAAPWRFELSIQIDEPNEELARAAAEIHAIQAKRG